MGGDIPKQFMPLNGIPLLCYSVRAFANAFRNISIILVVPEQQMDSARTIIKSYMGTVDVTTVAGGETRFHSVKNGLALVKNDGVVFVHDGVRPLVTEDLIQRCYDQAIVKGNAVPAVPVADSMRMIDAEGNSQAINRDNLRIIQTPQTFMTNVILPAFAAPYNASFTDEATVVESSGVRINLVEGDRNNLKITTPEDLVLAEMILKTNTL
jgi:2-C-methyl-D-erythritol 4-phosphate cytidylyltransferase